MKFIKLYMNNKYFRKSKVSVYYLIANNFKSDNVINLTSKHKDLLYEYFLSLLRFEQVNLKYNEEKRLERAYDATHDEERQKLLDEISEYNGRAVAYLSLYYFYLVEKSKIDMEIFDTLDKDNNMI